VTTARALIIGLVVAAMVSIAAPAFAYSSEATAEMIESLPMMRSYLADPDDPESWTYPDPETDCYICHGTQAADEPSGPHGGYLTSTNKCAVCHAVHTAPADGVLLLPAAPPPQRSKTRARRAMTAPRVTVSMARSKPAGSRLQARIASSIPPSPRPRASLAVTGADCHSPHGGNVVEAFTGDRARSSIDTAVTSTRLLKRRPTSASAEVDVYGSDWCGGCHQGRLSGSHEVANHPVDSSVTQTQTVPFYYDNIVRITGPLVSTVETGTLGRNNFGYVMPDEPRSSLQDGRYPICQQCHEDARNVRGLRHRPDRWTRSRRQPEVPGVPT